MKNQSTLETIILIGIIVAISISVMALLYNASSKETKSLTKLTSNKFNIYGLNFDFSTTSNELYGHYSQSGQYTYSNVIFLLNINGSLFNIPVSTTFYNTSIGSLEVNFHSTPLTGKVLTLLTSGENSYILETLTFSKNESIYSFDANESGVISDT